MRSFIQLVAVAAVITNVFSQQFNDGYENVNSATDPVQIRLAYQGPSAMMVSWNTFAQLSNPTVTYGLSPGALTLSASSSVSATYPTSLTYNNHVNITGLLPYTTYYYLPQYSNATTPYTFTTARLAGDMTPFTVGVVVDMGTFGALGLSTVVGTGAANPLAVNEQTTIAAITAMKDSYEFMVHAGDIAYADYWLKEEIQNYLPTTTTDQGAAVYESILNAFFDEIEDITTSKPYMVAPGNHEANCDNGGTTNKVTGQKYTASICLVGQTNFTGYINHWRMPSGPSGGVGNFWYSYDYGMAHFVYIDTETDLGNGVVGPDEGSPEFAGPFGTYNQQINWLTNDLASVNRTLTPWIVVFGHRGWYLSSTACTTCQTAFENLFYTYGVDLYINGHAHLYERTAPMYHGVVDPNGLNNPRATLYITNGAAGHYDGLDTFGTIQPYSVFHTAADYAWTTISFANSTHMTINTLWSANNTVFDTADLYKDHVFSSTSSNSSSTVLSSSASLAVISTVTVPTPTTNTVTKTNTAALPTYTNFNGQGHLFVVSSNTYQGNIGSAGTWYNAPGQNVATYTAVPADSSGATFIIQHGSTYCNIGSDLSFGCAITVASGATLFGQTPDGNLTYNGSPAFYASSIASTGARPTIYVKPLAVSMNIIWGGTGVAIVAPVTTSTAVSSSSSSLIAKTSSGSSASITSSPSSSIPMSSSAVQVTPSSLLITSSTLPIPTSSSVSAAAGSSSSTLPGVLSSSSSEIGLSSSIVVPASFSLPNATTSTSKGSSSVSSSSSGATTSSSSSVMSSSSAAMGASTLQGLTISSALICASGTANIVTQISTQVSTQTITTSYPIYTTLIGATTITSYATNLVTATQFITVVSQVPTAITSVITITQTMIATQDDLITVVQTAIQPASTITVSQEVSTVTVVATQDNLITVVQTLTPTASTVIISQQASTVTIGPGSITCSNQPGSTLTVSQPVSTVTVFDQGSIVFSTLPASTVTVSQAVSTLTVFNQGSVIFSTIPASTVTISPSVSITTVFQQGSVIISTQPASTITISEPAMIVTSIQPASTLSVTITQTASLPALTSYITLPGYTATGISTEYITEPATACAGPTSTFSTTSIVTVVVVDTQYKTKTANAITHTTIFQTVTNVQAVKTTVFSTSTKTKVVVSTTTSTTVKVKFV